MFKAKSIELQTITVTTPYGAEQVESDTDQAVLSAVDTNKVLDDSTDEAKEKFQECHASNKIACQMQRYGRRDAPKSVPRPPCNSKLCQILRKKQDLLFSTESFLREMECEPHTAGCKWGNFIGKKRTRKTERKSETATVDESSFVLDDDQPRPQCGKEDNAQQNPSCRWLSTGRKRERGPVRSAADPGVVGQGIGGNKLVSIESCPLQKELACGVFFGRRNDIQKEKRDIQVNNNSSKRNRGNDNGGSIVSPGSAVTSGPVTTRDFTTSPTTKRVAIADEKLLVMYTDHSNPSNQSQRKNVNQRCKPSNPYCRFRFLIGK